jgi:DNA-3-methyladenine glycosylase II
MAPEIIEQAEQALIQADPALGALIQRQTLKPMEPRTDYFASLCRAIVGQQVSVVAAHAIYARLEAGTNMLPSAVEALSYEQTRIIGLSKQKTTYIQDLARHYANNPAMYTYLEKLPDEEVIAELVQVKGIGTWTAQMFLMFTLGRMNVFAPDDAGLQNAILQLYKFESLPPKRELVQLAENWAPYKTIASLHLWESLNSSPA